MRMTDLAPSIMRGALAYPVIVFALLTGPGCGSKEATKPAPSLGDGKATRAIFAKAPKGFGPDPKAPLGKFNIDVPAQTNPRRR
jgi:hypothetical protein